MILKDMSFKEDEDTVTMPASITVEITIEEAIWIASVAGQQKGTSPHNQLYQCLASDVFNPYWEDGVGGAQQDYKIETPPIKYEE